MQAHYRARVYVVLRTTPRLLALYRRREPLALLSFTQDLLRQTDRCVADADSPDSLTQFDPRTFNDKFKVVATPSLDWRPNFPGPDRRSQSDQTPSQAPIVPNELIIVYATENKHEALGFVDLVNRFREQTLDSDGHAFVGAGFDPGGAINDHWCPGSANLSIFGHRQLANDSIGARELSRHGWTGQNVNVVIIDEGLDRLQIPVANWGGGLDHYIDNNLALHAGTAGRTSHGMMIARSILSLAPNARLYDVPVIPRRAHNPVPIFVSNVQSAYASLITEINRRRSLSLSTGPWILVNAWGIYNTRTDPFLNYCANNQKFNHPMIDLITQAVEDCYLDIVFAAGNCGQFCPDRLCGPRDNGPGRSIWGANAHPLVTTVGAVRSDDTWLGYSSEGPGPERLAIEKPDICAPSQFCEDEDAATISSGSSASCGVLAGVMAALRGNPAWSEQSVTTPAVLKSALTASARKPRGPTGWDRRFGYGVVDVAKTIETLSA